MITCPACAGHEIVLLGTLRDRAQVRCRLCAWTFHVDVKDLPEDDDKDLVEA